MAKLITTEEFKQKIKMISPTIEIIGEYKGSLEHIDCRCTECGHEWSPFATTLSQGSGCPVCHTTKPKTHDQFVRDVKKIHGNDISVVGKYINAKTKIDFCCNNCGNIWPAKPNNVLNGQGCPKCGKEKQIKSLTKTTAEFIEEMAFINSNIEIIGEYKTAHKPIKCRCLLCNHIWSPNPQDLRHGNGCPNCDKSGTSYVEQVILLALRKKLGDKNVYSRNTSIIGMELDIYLPEYRLAIEPGAWYWHKRKLDNDKKKEELCQLQGIRLITIYDTCDEDYNPNNDDCYVYKCDLSLITNFHLLKDLVQMILNICGEKEDFSQREWYEIKNEAYKKSRIQTTDDFKHRLEEINPDIEVLGEYHGALNHIECKCHICNYIWDKTTPAKLLSGRGCPKCAKNRLKRPVLQYDVNYCFIKEYESIAAASKAINVSQPSLINACRGRTRTSGGFIWRYKDEMNA